MTADGDFQGGFFFQSGATASYVNLNTITLIEA